jgi:hypothetical protein
MGMDTKLFLLILRRVFRASLWLIVAFICSAVTTNHRDGWMIGLLTCWPFVFPALGAAIGELTGRLTRWFFLGFAIPVFAVIGGMAIVVLLSAIRMAASLARALTELVEILMR